MLHKEIPFLRICVPLCSGIIAGLYFDPGLYGIIILFSFCISAFIISSFFNKRITNHLFGLAIFLTMFSTGLYLYNHEKNSLSSLKKETALFTGTLEDYPEEKEKSFMLTVKLSMKNDSGRAVPVKGSIVLYHKKDSLVSSLLPGDILVFRCTPAEIVNRGNPYEFDYRFFMESRGIKYYGFTSQKDLLSISAPESRKLRYSALIIRDRIIGMYEKRGITGKRLALVAAITLGEKEGLDEEQKQNFIKAGVMHIMAVSGLHAMILSLFVFNLLFFMKGRYNIMRVLITIIILWAFAFVTGLTPSVLRATLMFSFLQAGNLLRRRVNGINSILASAFILIIIRPSVIFDAGFLLSYSAVIFIIGFYNEFHNLISFRRKLPDLIWQSIAVTMVAQAGTLPLTIMLFNRFPTLFLITNAVIVPLSSVVVITGCILPLLFPFAHLSGIIALVLDRLTGVTEYLTAKAASVPWSTIEKIGLTTGECITLFIFVTFLMVFFLRKPRISPVYPLTALLLFVCFLTFNSIRTGDENELIVYNTPGYTTVGVKRGKLLEVFSENTEVPREVLRHSSFLRLKVNYRMISDSSLMINAGSKRILISDKVSSRWFKPERCDIVILTGRKPFSKEDLISSENNKQVVILAGSPGNILKSSARGSLSANLIRSVRETGAVRIRL